MGTKVHVPSVLVFETLSTCSASNKNIPEKEEQMKALRTARDEVGNTKDEQRIKQAVSHNISPAAHYKFKIGDQLYAYSESRQRWISGWTSVEVDGKLYGQMMEEGYTG